MSLLELILPVLAGGATYWYNRWRSTRAIRALRPVATSAGITSLEETSAWAKLLRLTGWYGAQQVDLTGPDHDKDPCVHVKVYGLLPGLELRGPAKGAPGGATTGDDDFDRIIEAHGPRAALQAVLDLETRARVSRLLAEPEWPLSRCEVAEGKLHAAMAHPPRIGPQEAFVGALRRMLEAAERLVAPEDVAARLCANVRSDPQAGVRLRSLETLVRTFPDHPAAHEALAAAREDRSDQVRLGAGLALGPAGLDLVREIAQAEGADDDSAARAVVALGPDLTLDRVLEMLGQTLRRRRLRSAEACLAWLGGYGGAEALGVLAKVLAIEHGELAVAAAGALGVGGLSAAEAPLIRALENADRDRDVRLAAVEALEAVGTAAAVLPLKAVTGDPVLERAARQALAAIQSRLTGTPGELSLAGGEEGQLTLSEGDSSGRLTLTSPASGKAEP